MNEDLFLDHSDHLVAFVSEVRSAWDPRWGTFATDLPERLCAGIGEGLISFLWVDRDRRLVTKSPSVLNLERFFLFFPTARLLILVRDGRSVVQSAVDTFGWDFDRACRAWADAARTIHRYQHAQASPADQWRVVRYEDLVDDPEGQLRAIFQFLSLDPVRYDFEAARNLPVRGSSAFGRQQSKVHWDTVPKDESFAPKERWRSWSPDQVKRFDWLAGKEMQALGYATSSRRFSSLDAANHRLRDWRWQTRRTARLLLYQARVRLALRSRIAQTLRNLRTRPAASSDPRP